MLRVLLTAGVLALSLAGLAGCGHYRHHHYRERFDRCDDGYYGRHDRGYYRGGY